MVSAFAFHHRPSRRLLCPLDTRPAHSQPSHSTYKNEFTHTRVKHQRGKFVERFEGFMFSILLFVESPQNVVDRRRAILAEKSL